MDKFTKNSKTVMMWNIIKILNNSFLVEYVFIFWFITVIKADFQHHYCSLQCHMILQK